MLKITQAALLDVGDIYAPKGTTPWLLGVREHARSALHNAKTTREEVRAWVNALKENDRFRSLTDASGQPFLAWEAFCQETPPYGFGMTAGEVDALIESKPLGQQLAADPEVKPFAEHGANKRQAEGDYDVISEGGPGNSVSYLVRRLKRDAPEVAAALARGEYASARAAGIAAGIVRVPTPLDLGKRAWGKMSAAERKAFSDWIFSEEAQR